MDKYRLWTDDISQAYCDHCHVHFTVKIEHSMWRDIFGHSAACPHCGTVAGFNAVEDDTFSADD